MLPFSSFNFLLFEHPDGPADISNILSFALRLLSAIYRKQQKRIFGFNPIFKKRLKCDQILFFAENFYEAIKKRAPSIKLVSKQNLQQKEKDLKISKEIVNVSFDPKLCSISASPLHW